MFTKAQLEARKKKLEAKRDELLKRSDESNDVDEVRAIGDRLRDIVDDLKDIEQDLLDIAESEGNDGNDGNEGDNGQRSFNPMATYGIAGAQIDKRDDGDKTNSMEYRNAFKDFVASGKPIPRELRDDENTLTTDVASVIPTVLVNRIIERMEICGMILPLITRTSYAAGVVIPTSNVKPVASWVAEGAGSDRQKKTTGKIVFAYNKLRCEISMSMEVGTMAISAFETAFVANVADAMVIAIEKAVLAGSGSGQPLGIFNCVDGTSEIEAVPADHKIELAAAIPTYAELVAAEAAVPVEYENTAKWFMTKKQFMNFLAMTDNNKQPIARVNYGIDGKPERVLLGREVILHPYATEMGDYVAAIFDFKDYVLNTIYDMGIQKKQDWDTEDLLTKAVMSVDGKPVDVHSLILLSVGSSNKESGGDTTPEG